MTTEGYVISGCRKLVAALIATGVRDALDGDGEAMDWIVSEAFGHWCEYVDIDPTWARSQIEAKMATAQARMADSRVLLAIEYHQKGISWERAAEIAIGTKSEVVAQRIAQIAAERFDYRVRHNNHSWEV